MTQNPHKRYTVYCRISPDGRVYVGCTYQTLEQRSGPFGERYADNKRFYEAIQKYGWESFRTEVILVTDSLEEASQAELAKIKEYDATNPDKGFNLRNQCYMQNPEYSENLSKAVKSSFTDEVRARKSESMKKYYSNPENAEFHKKRVHRVIDNPEVRARLIAANRRNLAKPEVIAKISKSIREVWTDEKRRIHGEMIKEKLSDPAVRSRISEGTKSGLASPEVRKKMSEAQSEKWNNPEFRERQLVAIREACNTPEHRKRISEAGKIAQNRPEVKAKLSAAFSGLVFINNGIKNKRVKESEVEHYVSTGNWVRGKLPMGPRGPIDKLKNRTWIHKDDKAIMVSGVELQSYLESGWERGRGKLKK